MFLEAAVTEPSNEGDIVAETTQTEAVSRRNDRLEKHDLKKLTVSFSDITVREFPITFGDNPATPIGPPLTIEWEYQSEKTVSVAEYEEMRPKRRRGDEMIIPSKDRHGMLMKAGFSRSEIVKLTKDVNIARQRHKRTAQTLDLAGLQLLSEGLTKNAMNLLSFGRSKRKERSLHQKFLANRTPMEEPVNTEPESSSFAKSSIKSSPRITAADLEAPTLSTLTLSNASVETDDDEEDEVDDDRGDVFDC